ncbi:MAG: hypothetical protein WAN50_00360 [Minisyncoccia bacterium]
MKKIPKTHSASKSLSGIFVHHGALHHALNVPMSERIPAKKLAAARAGKDGPKVRREADLAKTFAKHRPGKTGTGKYLKGKAPKKK